MKGIVADLGARDKALANQMDYLRAMAMDSLHPLLNALCLYLGVIFGVICLTAHGFTLNVCGLLAQKLVWIGAFLLLKRSLRRGHIPTRAYESVVTLVIVLSLSSALFSVIFGMTWRFPTQCLVFLLICALVDITLRQAVLHWGLIWASWAWVASSLDHTLVIEETAKLLGIQLVAIVSLVMRLRLYGKQYHLLRDLNGALKESETIRADLDKAVENRTLQLRVAYDELHQSIAERERMAQELLQNQKMESLGRLAGGVAHDFNNLLTVILGNLDLARRTNEPSQDWVDLLQEANTAACRASEVTNQLLAYSRKQVMNVKPVRLQRVVEECVEMVRRLVGEAITVEFRLECPNAIVEADSSRLQQVILNLAGNARDAMPNGGRLEISLRPAGGDVELRIKDTGCGIDPSLHRRIFEPFFTNKPFGEGPGLGLATVEGIVSMHFGRISVDSEVGQGAIFSIYLPACIPTGEGASGRRSLTPGPGVGNILLVEDDAQVRNLALRVLRLSGYQVRAVDSGEKALQSLGDGTEYDLLVTDVVMQGMDGGKLAEAVRHHNAALPVLFMSGFADDRLTHFGIQRGECDFLAKPFTPAQLHRCVADILQRAHI